jgi:hypothetical protein
MPRSAILRQQGCRWSKDANTEECYTKGAGMLMLMERGCQCREVLYRGSRDADTEEEGMPMEQECQYRWRGDANTKREGMLILRARGCRRSKDADTEECYGAGMPMLMERGCQY